MAALKPALSPALQPATSGADLELTSGTLGRNPSELGMPEFSSAGTTATDVMPPGGIDMPNDGSYEYVMEPGSVPADQTAYIDPSHLYGVYVDASHDGSPLQVAATGDLGDPNGRMLPDPSHADDKGGPAENRRAPEPNVGNPSNHLVQTPSSDNLHAFNPDGTLVTVPGDRVALDVAHESNDGILRAAYTGYSERPLYVTTADMPPYLESGGDRIGDNSMPGNAYADGGFGPQSVPLNIPGPPDPAIASYQGDGSAGVMDLGYGGNY